MKLRLFAITIIVLSSFLGGCATTIIEPAHPSYVSEQEPHATLVFYRPLSQRTRGVADYDIKVEVDSKLMLKLSAGEYAAKRIKPGKNTLITMRNMTYIAAKPMPEEVWRSRRFNFEAGKTYYIVADLRIEEYRGIYYQPKEATADAARAQLTGLKPAGELAKAMSERR